MASVYEDYLVKFLDENVCVYSEDMQYVHKGTCTKYECSDIDSDHAQLIITTESNENVVFDIWEYNYKTQSWYDGIQKMQLYIKII